LDDRARGNRQIDLAMARALQPLVEVVKEDRPRRKRE
jgi:hypothetical protein